MTEILDMYNLIAAEFHVLAPDSLPVYQLQYMAKSAEKRRNDRQKAAADGLTYVG